MKRPLALFLVLLFCMSSVQGAKIGEPTDFTGGTRPDLRRTCDVNS
jgi:hypothetical protein